MLHVCPRPCIVKENDSAESALAADGGYLWRAEFWVILNCLYYTSAMFQFVQLIIKKNVKMTRQKLLQRELDWIFQLNFKIKKNAPVRTSGNI